MQIEMEHPPIDSAALDWAGNVIYFQIISPRIATEKVSCFDLHCRKSDVDMCKHRLLSSTSYHFQAHFAVLRALRKRLVQQWASSLILSSNESFFFCPEE